MPRRSISLSNDTELKVAQIRADRHLTSNQQAIDAAIDLAALFGDKTAFEIQAALDLAHELKLAVGSGNTVTVDQDGIVSAGPAGQTKLVITGLGLTRK